MLDAIAKGDRQAFARLYEATRGRLYAIALKLLKRGDWAEEVLQECYVSVWTRAREYSAAKGHPLAWLTGIVRNRCIDWLRRPDIEVPDIDDAIIDNTQDESPEPSQQLESKRAAHLLQRCMDRLEAKERQTLALAYYHGLTHSELASHLHEPLGTVKSRVRRALMSLSECMGQ